MCEPIAFYAGCPMAMPSEANLTASRVFAAQHAMKLPSVGCRIDTVVTDSDISRWNASFESESATLIALQDSDTADKMLPDLSVAAIRQETPDQVNKMCPIPPFAPTSVANRTGAKQLAHRAKWLAYRQKVRMYQQRSPFVAAVRDSRLISVVGGPHSGKSTQIPQLLSDTELFRRKRIIVVTGSPMASVLLARRLREEKGDAEPVIAHCIASSYQCTEATQIAVCTYDVLHRTMLADVRLQDVGCVVLDDLHVHTDVAMDLCLASLRDLLAHATANKELRVVLNCRDDVVEASLLHFFQPILSSINVGRQVIPDDASASAPPVAMYLDDAVQWLQKVDAAAPHGPPTLVTDPAADLADVANHVQVLSRVLASDDADLSKNNGKGLEAYWMPLMQQLLAAFDKAERQFLTASSNEGGSNLSGLSSVVVILPTRAMCLHAADRLVATAETAKFRILPFVAEASVVAMLARADAVHQAMLACGSGDVRTIVVATPAEVINSTLVPCLNIGCLVDLCRTERVVYDCGLEADRVVVGETLSKATMRHHRMLLSTANGIAPMSLQLIARQALHSPQRTKQFTPHPLTHACLGDLLHLVTYLQLRAQQQHNGSNSLGMRLHKLLLARCWDLQPAQIRSDTWQRLGQHAEAWLQHMGHLDSKYCVTALGAGALLMGLPWQVARLLLTGALLSEVPSSSLLAALWLAGGASQSTAATSSMAEDLEAYTTWRRSVAQTPSAEEGACPRPAADVSEAKLLEVRSVHSSLLRMMAQMHLAVPASVDDVDQMLCDETKASGFTLEAAGLSVGASACNHPNLVFSEGAVACGVPRVVDPAVPCLNSIGVNRTTVPLVAGVHVAFGRRAHPSGSHLDVSVAAPASLHALVVFCGQGSRQPIPVATRCRGWMSPITNVWRQTKAARHLPPPPQITARTVPVKAHNPSSSEPVQLELDRVIQIQTTSNCAVLLGKIREFAKRKMATVLSEKRQDVVTRDALQEVFAWLVQREVNQEDFLRDRRSHIAAPSATASSMPQLQAHLSFASGYDRPTLLEAVARTPTSAVAAPSQGQAPVAVAAQPAVALQFAGAAPPDQATQALIRRTAETIAKNPNRDGEAALMQRDNFSFLRPDHMYHEYYLYILKKEAPHLDWLGDDLPELEKWLRELEVQVASEVDGAQEQYSAEADAVGQQGTMFDATAYEEVSEEQYAAEVRRQEQAEEERRRAEAEEEAAKKAAEKPKPGATLSFLAPDASAQGVGSGVLGGGNTLLQRMMAMRSGTANVPESASELTSGPASHTAASIFGNLPGMTTPAAAGGAPDAASNAAPQQQLSAQELLAIISGGNFGMPPQEPQAALKPHPLTIPPPPLPSEALACRTSSVIVSPLPTISGMNLPLVLAKALGETLDMKVGPTLIVGDVARIEVPSSGVEMRALALKHFFCLGQKLTIEKNDRIVDNPNRVASRRIMDLKERLNRGGGDGGAQEGRNGAAHHQPEYEMPARPYQQGGRGGWSRGGGGRGGRGGRGGSNAAAGATGPIDAPKPVTSFVAPVVGSRYLQPPGAPAPEQPSAPEAESPAEAAGRRAGAFTDSDEE